MLASGFYGSAMSLELNIRFFFFQGLIILCSSVQMCSCCCYCITAHAVLCSLLSLSYFAWGCLGMFMCLHCFISVMVLGGGGWLLSGCHGYMHALLDLYITPSGGAVIAQWWECSPPTAVSWVEFALGSRPCSEGFSPGSLVFLPQHAKF